MGAYMSKPKTEKISDNGANQWISYSSCSMQGWRMHQEDAHNCLPNFDLSQGISFFAVYDGHGGSEVARYCAENMPKFLMNLPSYKNLNHHNHHNTNKFNMKETLKQLFLDFDATLVTPEAKVILNKMSELDKLDNDDEDDVSNKEETLSSQIHYTANIDSSNNHDDVDDDDDEAKEDEHYSELLALRAEANQPLEHVLEQYGGEDALPSSIKTILDSRRQQKLGECSHPTRRSSSKSSLSEDKNDSKLDSRITNSNTNTVNINETVEQEITSSSELNSKLDKPNCSEVNNANDNHDEKKELINTNDDDGDDNKSSLLLQETTNTIQSRDTIDQNENLLDESDDDSADFDPLVELEDSDDEEAEAEEEDDDEEDDDDDEEDDDDEDEEDEDDDDDDDDDELTGFSIPRSIADTEESEPGIDSGTTACVAVLVPVNNCIRLYVANAGDSRAVLCRGGAAVDLSVDHKPEDEDEKARIIAAGGSVTRDGRVNGGLNLSRALGDHSYKQTPNIPLTDQMITPSPDVTEIDLIPSADEFLVIACDGVWNSMTSQEVVEFIQDRLHSPTKLNNNNNNHSNVKTLNNHSNSVNDVNETGDDCVDVNKSNSSDQLTKICHEIFDHCLAPNTDGDGTGCDNMTCVIVRFNDLPGWVEYYANKNNNCNSVSPIENHYSMISDKKTPAIPTTTTTTTTTLSPRKRPFTHDNADENNYDCDGEAARTAVVNDTNGSDTNHESLTNNDSRQLTSTSATTTTTPTLKRPKLDDPLVVEEEKGEEGGEEEVPPPAAAVVTNGTTNSSSSSSANKINN